MDNWTELCRVANEIESQLVAGYLESFGIEVSVASNANRPYPENLGMLGAIKVRVQEKDLSKAQELLAELPQAEIADVPELAPDPTEGEQEGEEASSAEEAERVDDDRS